MSENTYILTSDGELYHWKYIKRERVNGKWRYTYPSSSKRNSIGSAKKSYNWIEDKLGIDEYDRYVAAGKAKSQAKLALSKSHQATTFSETMKSYKSAYTKYAKAGEEYVKAKKEFYNTPYGKLKKFGNSVKRGMKKVKRWFKNLGKN